MTKVTIAFFYLFSLLPFRMLYAISDFVYIFVYYVVRYRRSVVRSNLTSSFPEKTMPEIKDIEHRFYHFFCDYLFEAVKLLSISDAELRRRFKTVGSDEVRKCFAGGQDVAAVLGHYCNWEWLSCVGIDLPAESRMGLIYHPLKSTAFDELFRRIRSHEKNAVPVPKKDILRYLITYRRQNIRNIFGYISDQSPKWENIHLWMPFLNHPLTPVFTGGERIMKKMNNAVFYVEMSRPERGYYTCTYRLITREPAALPDNEITRRFMQMLEETIRREPAYYLWSHDRWRRTKEEFDRRFVVVNGKVLPRKQKE